ncbi:MAG: DUF1573 domain-containing protein [Bacteroidales bacterium]|nr:DUF1573 domain-containing protein [Bacteroides sp.]MCM1197617.1 DUF1573 domain-containing protein [Clostridium sp.]MCM1502358.1 DUF1573 domain-containing protein [Bacteroidales bacterium]
MKAFPVAAVALLALLSSCHNGGNAGAVKDIVTSENTEADLGTIREKDGPVHANLLVANTSSDTLMPLAVYTRCQCMSASVEREAVAPGETLKVEVTYNPAYRKGIFMEEVSVKMLGRSSMSLIVKGEVEPMEHPVEEDHPYDFGAGLHLSHEVLHYGKMQPGDSRTIYIRYANGGRKDMDVEFRPEAGHDGEIRVRERSVLPAGGRDTLHFRFTMPGGLQPGDTLKIPVKPYVNGKPSGKVLIVKAISSDC